MAFDAETFARDYGQLIDAFAGDLQPEWRIWTPLSPLFDGHAYFGSPVVAEIEASLRSIAATQRMKTLDLRTPLQEHGELFADHIHPNAAGAAIIAREIARELIPGTASQRR